MIDRGKSIKSHMNMGKVRLQMIHTIRYHIVVVLLLISDYCTFSFSLHRLQPHSIPIYPHITYRSHVSQRQASTNNPDVTSSTEPSPQELEYLKTELTAYLEKRKELNADEEANQYVGKTIGGSKNNKILEFVSAAPNKPQVIDRPPGILDYDELTKYGFGHLVVPIMNAGGRLKMYELMGLDVPPIPPSPVWSAPKIEIDRTGENDPNRYTGLKLGQVLDDDAQAAALEAYRKNRAQSTETAPKLKVPEFERPFADKRNTGPRQTPDWTVEKIDEWARKQGRVDAWVRKARAGQFVRDANEQLHELPWTFRLYSIVSYGTVAFAFGRASPQLLYFFSTANVDGSYPDLLLLLQVPATALLFANLGSGLYCGVTAKATQNRSLFVWMIKGLLAGPLAVRQLTNLPKLLTRQETNDDERKRT